jgi:hypothetical protein
MIGVARAMARASKNASFPPLRISALVLIALVICPLIAGVSFIVFSCYLICATQLDASCKGGVAHRPNF